MYKILINLQINIYRLPSVWYNNLSVVAREQYYKQGLQKINIKTSYKIV